MTDRRAKIFWIIAIVALGLTTAMNLFGGVGTVCAAFFTEDFPPLRTLLYHKWLYQRLMLITILIGLAGAWSTFALFRGGKHVYRNALVVLLMGTLIGDLHVTASLELRGKIVPANVKLYINLFTLILFLVIRLPTIGGRISFSSPGGKSEAMAAGSMAAMVVSITMLTINVWTGSSHVYEGANWIDVLQIPLTLGGVAFLLGGLGVFTRSLMAIFRQPEQVPLPNEAVP